MPALADPISVANPLLIDLNGNDKNANNQPNPNGTPDANCQTPQYPPAGGWYNWNFPFDGSSGTSPYSLNMQATHNTTVTLDTFRVDGAKTCGTRNRGAQTTTASQLGKMYMDIFYVAQNGAGLGRNYIKASFTITGLAPNSTNNFTFSLFDWDPAFKWSGLSGFGGANEPKNSKLAAWSLANPATWLADNGYPTGYEPNAVTSQMPGGLAAQLLGTTPDAYAGITQHGLVPMLGPAAWQPWLYPWDYRYATTFSLDLTANSSGVAMVSVYGWNHMTSWAGSQHMPINGIRVVPEPATVALLGLGGLALLRRRKH
jgi:hypothetical protein